MKNSTIWSLNTNIATPIATTAATIAPTTHAGAVTTIPKAPSIAVTTVPTIVNAPIRTLPIPENTPTIPENTPAIALPIVPRNGNTNNIASPTVAAPLATAPNANATVPANPSIAPPTVAITPPTVPMILIIVLPTVPIIIAVFNVTKAIATIPIALPIAFQFSILPNLASKSTNCIPSTLDDKSCTFSSTPKIAFAKGTNKLSLTHFKGGPRTLFNH